MIKYSLLLICSLLVIPLFGQQTDSILTYRIEVGVQAGNGTYAPLWFTSNRYGLISNESNAAYLCAGITYQKEFKHNWHLNAGMDLSGGANSVSYFQFQQFYADFGWKALNLSFGRKERSGFPLNKNKQLSSGMLVEGVNTRPIPQIRAEITNYLDVPGTKGWLAFKGHLAYGQFAENEWQKDFVQPGSIYVKDVLYHSKSLMLRLGNKEKLPIEFEFGILMAAQFGGDQYIKKEDGTGEKILDMPDNFKAYWKAFIPQAGGSDTPEGEQVNVEGNHVGSWNFALNYYLHDWKFRTYLEHYFEDTSGMFWEYGRWKDGQLGLEISFPKNRWISSLVWETMCTKDQAGPLLYDGFWGQFPEYQISANDNYYNHYIYGAWQYWGMGMGNALLPGPLYNKDHTITFKSNRVRSQHIGLEGNPFPEWNYRLLLSYTRHWGTYGNPLDKERKQFNSLIECTYTPQKLKGWSGSVSLGLDRGNYLGNSTGAMLSIKKTGSIF